MYKTARTTHVVQRSPSSNCGWLLGVVTIPTRQQTWRSLGPDIILMTCWRSARSRIAAGPRVYVPSCRSEGCLGLVQFWTGSVLMIVPKTTRHCRARNRAQIWTRIWARIPKVSEAKVSVS